MNRAYALAATLLCLMAMGGQPSAVAAIQPGQRENFEAGTLRSWQAGGSRNPIGPSNVNTGGPAGVDDNYLLIRSNGTSGAGGKLVVFNKSDWAGNYIQAQVSSISMNVSNFGTTDLILRLVLENLSARQSLGTIEGVLLKAGSGWTNITFPLDAGNLRGGNYNTVLANVGEFNLVHSSTVITDRAQSRPITARLGIDNIVAVPEPTGLVCLACGPLGWFLARRRRRAVAGSVIGVQRPLQGSPRWWGATGICLLITSSLSAAILPPIERGSIAVHLDPIVTGMGAPDYAISPAGDTSRLFVVEQNGLLRIIQNGTLLPGAALDLRSRVSPPFVPTNANDERGFLGLAFHPDFHAPGSLGQRTLYTYTSELIPVGTAPTYAAPNNAEQGFKLVIAEWKMSAADPNTVEPTSRREIISFGKNADNHNGGTIAFGPDGYLYLGLGDGGNANDVGASHIEPTGNGQNLGTPLGKMLRLDVIQPALTPTSTNPISANGQYRIPVDNPFQGAGQVPEIYAYGLRNPYRFAFDTAQGDLILADVGQRNVEEINRIVRGGNYGWAIKEGDFLFDRTTATLGARSPGSPAGLIDPISGPQGTLEYDHDDGISITGGFVYRGQAIPELFGKYVFGDLALRNLPPRVDGRLFYADLQQGVIKEFQIPQFLNGRLPNGLTVHGFGQDGAGELYALVTNTPANGTGGIVYKITAVPEPSSLSLAWVALAAGWAAKRCRR